MYLSLVKISDSKAGATSVTCLLVFAGTVNDSCLALANRELKSEYCLLLLFCRRRLKNIDSFIMEVAAVWTLASDIISG